jgi:hypothetical protein
MTPLITVNKTSNVSFFNVISKVIISKFFISIVIVSFPLYMLLKFYSTDTLADVIKHFFMLLNHFHRNFSQNDSVILAVG